MRLAAQNAGMAVDLRNGIIVALAFEADMFDVVLSSLMMHTLPDDLKHQELKEVARILKSGGRLLILDLKRPSEHLGRALLAMAFHWQSRQ